MPSCLRVQRARSTLWVDCTPAMLMSLLLAAAHGPRHTCRTPRGLSSSVVEQTDYYRQGGSYGRAPVAGRRGKLLLARENPGCAPPPAAGLRGRMMPRNAGAGSLPPAAVVVVSVSSCSISFCSTRHTGARGR